jgi:hypothetical protein
MPLPWQTNLTMAFSTDSTMALMYEAMTDDWQSGLVHKVAEEWKTNYQPQDTTAMMHIELRQMLNKVSMKTNKNPMSIFE